MGIGRPERVEESVKYTKLRKNQKEQIQAIVDSNRAKPATVVAALIKSFLVTKGINVKACLGDNEKKNVVLHLEGTSINYKL